MSSSHRALRNHLFRLRQNELDELFATLPVNGSASSAEPELMQPQSGYPEGNYRGALMAIAGVQRLPRMMATLVYRFLSTPLNPWRGKTFSASEGANIWFSGKGYLRFGRYHNARTEHGLDLDYGAMQDGTPVNPGLLRSIRGEARFLQNGMWLARMRWQSNPADRSTRTTLLYFVLWQD